MEMPECASIQRYLIENKNLFQDMIVNFQSFYIVIFKFYPLMTTHKSYDYATINIYVQLLTMSFISRYDS